jgi:hypothetical protein
MGPKAKDSTVSVPSSRDVVGAKFAYVAVGQRSNLCKIMVNLNCNLEILLDSAKSQLLKKLEERIAVLKGENNTDGEGVGVSNQDAVVQKLLEFQALIQNDVGNIDLIDANGNPSGCNQVTLLL